MLKIITTLALVLTMGCSKSPSPSVNPEISSTIELTDVAVLGSGDFGDIAADSIKLLTLRIKNSGDENILGNFIVTGEGLSIAYQNGCENFTVNSWCVVKLSFDARGKTPGNKIGTLGWESITTPSIMINSQVLPPLGSAGNPTAETIEWSSTSLNFGVLTNKKTVVKSLILTNKSLIVLNKTITGGENFIKIYDSCSGKDILPNKTCQIKLSLSGNGNSSTLNETLNYGSLNPAVNLSATLLNFQEAANLGADLQVLYHSAVVSGDSPAVLGDLVPFKNYLFTFFVKNQGTEPSQVSSVSMDSPMNLLYNSCSLLAPKKVCVLKGFVQVPDNNPLTLNLTVNSSTGNLVVPLKINQPAIPTAQYAFSSTLKSSSLNISPSQKTISALNTSPAPVISWAYVDKYVTVPPTGGGKIYIEFQFIAAYYSYIGGNFLSADPTIFYNASWPFGLTAGYTGWYSHQSENRLFINVSSAVDYSPTYNWNGNGIVMLAIDLNANKVWQGVNGVWVGDPALNIGGLSLNAARGGHSRLYFAAALQYGSVSIVEQPQYLPVGFSLLD